MKLLGYNFSVEKAVNALDKAPIIPEIKAGETPVASGGYREGSLDEILGPWMAAYQSYSGIHVTPDNAMEAPTVQAIVNAITKRLAISPIQVLRVTRNDKGRPTKEVLYDHPVALLLKKPNGWMSDVEYRMDMASMLARWNRYYALMGKIAGAPGNTASFREKLSNRQGQVLSINPIHPRNVQVYQNSDFSVYYEATGPYSGENRTYLPGQIHSIRGPARDFLCGDSIAYDIREAIAMEIAAERFGATFFANGAMPFIVFKFMQGIKGFKTDEEKAAFVKNFQEVYGDRRRFQSMVIPAGMEIEDPISVANDNAQMLETRRHQRTVIAGGWNCPPHLVGDLTNGTFNNVEQQSLDFILNCVLPYTVIIEAAMARDLLTDADRSSGVILKFNLADAMRGDYKSQQEALKIQRDSAIINANEWREQIDRDPISDDEGGEDYIRAMNFTTPEQADAAARAAEDAANKPSSAFSKPSSKPTTTPPSKVTTIGR